MKKKQITAAIPAVLLVLGLILAGCPQATGGGGGDDPIPPIPDDATAYTVKFEAYSGSPAPAQATIGKGKKVTEPGAMTKTGYVFMGWFTEATFANRWNFSTGTVSANMTLYAKWVPLPNSVSEIASYIDAEATAGRGDSASNPISIPAEINLGSEWQDLLDVIAGKGKFVELDLTRCAMDGTAFNPNKAVSTGKDKIVKLILPDAAESIAAGTSPNPTFRYFTALTSVAGANIEEIGDYAFASLTSLSSVSFPAAISIGANAFYRLTNLTSASFPAATSIGDRAFLGCTGLTSVSFSAAATLGTTPFASCLSLTFTVTGDGHLSVKEGGKALVRNDVELIVYPSASGSITVNDITRIDAYAFYNCTSLTSVSFPAAASIGDYAFYYCSNLSNASFPEVESIGKEAFYYSNLSNASFPKAKSIGESAFIGCSRLAALDISSVTSIGRAALSFTGTTALTITMGDPAPTVGNLMFYSVSSTKIVTVEVPSGATGYNSTWKDAFKGGNSNISLDVESL